MSHFLPILVCFVFCSKYESSFKRKKPNIQYSNIFPLLSTQISSRGAHRPSIPIAFQRTYACESDFPCDGGSTTEYSVNTSTLSAFSDAHSHTLNVTSGKPKLILPSAGKKGNILANTFLRLFFEDSA